MTSVGPERRVLVVEDELLVAALLQDMLTDLGCAVVGPAARVAEALALIDGEAIDAAVLDVNLNRELSYPVADALVARHIPFLFSTGYGVDRIPGEYASHRILQKPYHGSELGRALRDLFPARPLTIWGV